MSSPPTPRAKPRTPRARSTPAAPGPVSAPSPALPAKGSPRARDIGLDVRLPKTSCSDAKCPFHGHVKVRGQELEGVVVSTQMQGTVVVSRTLLHFLSKYERYAKRRHRILAHAPACLKITEGRRVRIAETRPLAKNVSFVVVADLGRGEMEVHGEEERPLPRAEEVPPPGSPDGGAP